MAIRIFVRAPATAAAISGVPSVPSFRALAVKALWDKMSAASALYVLAPLFAAIALVIKITDRGPVFSRQTRIGKNGQPFSVWKFRTMKVGAGARNAQLLQLAWLDENGTLFKSPQDPQLTRAGAWLRRWSLDELPQLFNVLAGDMSLVGPRPALPAELAGYDDHMRRRLAAKPGITGLWQVSGRSDLPWDEMKRLDLLYVDNWSLALDLQIIWKSLPAIFRGWDSY